MLSVIRRYLWPIDGLGLEIKPDNAKVGCRKPGTASIIFRCSTMEKKFRCVTIPRISADLVSWVGGQVGCLKLFGYLIFGVTAARREIGNDYYKSGRADM